MSRPHTESIGKTTSNGTKHTVFEEHSGVDLGQKRGVGTLDDQYADAGQVEALLGDPILLVDHQRLDQRGGTGECLPDVLGEQIQPDLLRTDPGDVPQPGLVVGARRVDEVVVLLQHRGRNAGPLEVLRQGGGGLGLAAARLAGDGDNVQAVFRQRLESLGDGGGGPAVVGPNDQTIADHGSGSGPYSRLRPPSAASRSTLPAALQASCRVPPGSPDRASANS